MPASDTELLLTTVDAARRCNVTTQTIRSWIDRGRLTATQIGRRYRIPASEIEALLAGERNIDDAARQGANAWDGRVPELLDAEQQPDTEPDHSNATQGDAWGGRVELLQAQPQHHPEP